MPGPPGSQWVAMRSCRGRDGGALGAQDWVSQERARGPHASGWIIAKSAVAMKHFRVGMAHCEVIATVARPRKATASATRKVTSAGRLAICWRVHSGGPTSAPGGSACSEAP
jgi:hypothetical protein